MRRRLPNPNSSGRTVGVRCAHPNLRLAGSIALVRKVQSVLHNLHSDCADNVCRLARHTVCCDAMNNSPLNAADPRRSAAVMASAGTGKTWLLVTRLIRLLLDGARPDGLLAVTFTRKAAAEMQLRLLQRLRELAECDSAALDQALTQIGAPKDSATRATRAAALRRTALQRHTAAHHHLSRLLPGTAAAFSPGGRCAGRI